jgi:hypothetical protein
MPVSSKTEINLLRLLSRSQKQVDELIGGDEDEAFFLLGRFRASINYMNVLHTTLKREKLCPESRLVDLRARIDNMQSILSDNTSSSSSTRSSLLSDRSEGERIEKIDMIAQEELRAQLLTVSTLSLISERIETCKIEF